MFHSNAAFGEDHNWLQDADINLMLRLSQFDKHPRLKLSRKIVIYALYSSSQITSINYLLFQKVKRKTATRKLL